MKCFPFLLTKEPLDVIGAVQCPGAGSVLRHSLQWICKLENLLQPRPIQKQNSNSRSNIDSKIFKSKYFIKSLLENCFLVRKKLPTIFVNVKKVLFHWKGFFNLPHLAQESIKEQAWAKKLKQWRKKGDLKHILCRKPHFDRLENFLPPRGQNQVGLPSMNILDALSLLSHSVASCSVLFLLFWAMCRYLSGVDRSCNQLEIFVICHCVHFGR